MPGPLELEGHHHSLFLEPLRGIDANDTMAAYVVDPKLLSHYHRYRGVFLILSQGTDIAI